MGRSCSSRSAAPKPADRVRQTWRGICPDFEAYVVEFLAGEVWSRPGLDLRTKSLVAVATLAAQGRTLGRQLNLRMALKHGATRQEVIETLLQIAPDAGFPACWEGLALTQNVFREVDAGA